MLNRMALLSVAALAAAALPHAASAADYYDEGRGPAVYDGRGDAAFDHGWQDSRRDLRPRFRPGPVAFDERGEERFARGEPEFDEGGPVLASRPGVRRGTAVLGSGRLRPAAPARAGLPPGRGARLRRRLRPARRAPGCRLHRAGGAVGHSRGLAQDRDLPDLLPALSRHSRLRNPAKVIKPSGHGPWPDATLICPALPASTKAEPQAADSVAVSSMSA